MLHDAEKLAVRIVVVAFASAQSLIAYQHRHGLDHLLVLSDPDRHAYRAFGLGRGSVLRIWLDPRVWARYLQLMLRGRRPEAAHEDTLQLGGDALVDSDGRITWIHRSRGPEDRPSVADIQMAIDRR